MCDSQSNTCRTRRDKSDHSITMVCTRNYTGFTNTDWNMRDLSADHLPPSGPSVNVQIDFMHMLSCQGYKHLLVITNMFSKWVESYPTRKEDARTVVKCLIKELIPCFGVPTGINSDRGPAFVAKITQSLAAALRFQWKLHVLCHPQSSEMGR